MLRVVITSSMLVFRMVCWCFVWFVGISCGLLAFHVVCWRFVWSGGVSCDLVVFGVVCWRLVCFSFIGRYNSSNGIRE